MTGKVLDSSSSGVLILIIPAAVAVIFLYNFWPILLGIAIFSIAWTIWQNYQWQQTCIRVNPYFNQLLKENQGCLTPVDLSLKANLSGGAARAFLERKAGEYGGKRQTLPDKGVVYYFITASSLGSIFDDSDFLVKASEEKAIAAPEAKPQISAGITPSIKQGQFSSKNDFQAKEPELATVPTSSSKVSSEPSATDDFRETEAIESTVTETKQLEEIQPAPQEEKTETKNEEQTKQETTTSTASTRYEPLIQSELAKRLEINPSTIGRKKSDSDFPQWSQSRDPEGVSWQYVADTKMFVPVDGT